MSPILPVLLFLSISLTVSKPVFDLIPEAGHGGQGGQAGHGGQGGHASALAGQRETLLTQGDPCTCPEGRQGDVCKLDSMLVCRRQVSERPRRHKNRRRRMREQLRRILQRRE